MTVNPSPEDEATRLALVLVQQLQAAAATWSELQDILDLDPVGALIADDVAEDLTTAADGIDAAAAAAQNILITLNPEQEEV